MKNYLKHLLLSIFFSVFFTFPLHSKIIESYSFDFTDGTQGWVGDFADYPVDQETFYELSWGWSNLPNATPVKSVCQKGLVISGNNHSDDLFMFFRRKIRNLEPNTDYELEFNIMIESNVAPGEIGTGGSPGESVFFKVGASNIRPKKIVSDLNRNFYILNADKGHQANDGTQAVVIGNIANPEVDPRNRTYHPKELRSDEKRLNARTDEHGQLWIFIGTDSGFEATTKYYISHVEVNLRSVY